MSGGAALAESDAAGASRPGMGTALVAASVGEWTGARADATIGG